MILALRISSLNDFLIDFFFKWFPPQFSFLSILFFFPLHNSVRTTHFYVIQTRPRQVWRLHKVLQKHSYRFHVHFIIPYRNPNFFKSGNTPSNIFWFVWYKGTRKKPDKNTLFFFSQKKCWEYSETKEYAKIFCEVFARESAKSFFPSIFSIYWNTKSVFFFRNHPFQAFLVPKTYTMNFFCLQLLCRLKVMGEGGWRP